MNKMPAEKCIPVKKKLIDYMSKQFPYFPFEGGNSTFYAFRRENPDGIYDHIIPVCQIRSKLS